MKCNFREKRYMSKSSFSVSTKITKELKDLLQELADKNTEGNLSRVLNYCLGSFVKDFKKTLRSTNDLKDYNGQCLLGETPKVKSGGRLLRVGLKVDNSKEHQITSIARMYFDGSKARLLRAAILFMLVNKRIGVN